MSSKSKLVFNEVINEASATRELALVPSGVHVVEIQQCEMDELNIALRLKVYVGNNVHHHYERLHAGLNEYNIQKSVQRSTFIQAIKESFEGEEECELDELVGLKFHADFKRSKDEQFCNLVKFASIPTEATA